MGEALSKSRDRSDTAVVSTLILRIFLLKAVIISMFRRYGVILRIRHYLYNSDYIDIKFCTVWVFPSFFQGGVPDVSRRGGFLAQNNSAGQDFQSSTLEKWICNPCINN